MAEARPADRATDRTTSAATIGCGCIEANDRGLTEFGRICIREINECGMVVDLAHAGQRRHCRRSILAQAADHQPCQCPRAVRHPRNPSATTYCARSRPRAASSASRRTRRSARPSGHAADRRRFRGPHRVRRGSGRHRSRRHRLGFFEGESPIRFERFFRRRYPAIVGYTIDTVYAQGFAALEDFAALPGVLRRRGFGDDEFTRS